MGGGEHATTSDTRPFVRMPGSSDTAPAYKMMTSTPKEPSSGSGGGLSALRPYKVKRDFRSGVVGSKLRLDDSKLDSFCTVDGEAGDTIVGKDMDETGVAHSLYPLFYFPNFYQKPVCIKRHAKPIYQRPGW